MLEHFEDLDVYQRSFELALTVHKLTLCFPDIEKEELGRQLRKASKSICANIAEGFGRRQSSRDFKHFLVMALGSADECQCHLKFAIELGYIDQIKGAELIESFRISAKQLNRLNTVWRDLSSAKAAIK